MASTCFCNDILVSLPYHVQSCHQFSPRTHVDLTSKHCRTGIHYNPKDTITSKVGLCVVPGLTYPDGSPIDGLICDIRYKGLGTDPTQKPCANFEDSQFAVSFFCIFLLTRMCADSLWQCKHDGDTCQIYHLTEDPTLGVAHCQWPSTILN